MRARCKRKGHAKKAPARDAVTNIEKYGMEKMSRGAQLLQQLPAVGGCGSLGRVLVYMHEALGCVPRATQTGYDGACL